MTELTVEEIQEPTPQPVSEEPPEEPPGEPPELRREPSEVQAEEPAELPPEPAPKRRGRKLPDEAIAPPHVLVHATRITSRSERWKRSSLLRIIANGMCLICVCSRDRFINNLITTGISLLANRFITKK